MNLNPLELIEALDTILIPIQKIISSILPDFLEKNLDDTEVREMIVEAVDIALCSQVPEAKLIPEDIRKQIIRKLLDTMLDDIVLPERGKS